MLGPWTAHNAVAAQTLSAACSLPKRFAFLFGGAVFGLIVLAALQQQETGLSDSASLSLWPSGMFSTPPPANEGCYPYHDPGIMTLNHTAPAFSTYTSITGHCPARNDLLWGLLSGTAPPTLHNRHILLVGDSVDRALADYFGSCPGSIALIDVDAHLQDNGAKQVPRSYHFPSINLTVSSYFMYGLDEKNIWRNAPFERPLLWYDRLDTLAAMWASRAPPDLIVTQSGLWDLAAYTHPDETPSDHSELFDKGMHPSFAGPWTDRAEHFIHKLRDIFPNTKIYWRTIHLAAGPYRYFGAKANAVDPLRISQMREMQLAVTDKMAVPVMPVHKMVEHQELVMLDQIHLSPLGCTVYAEMTLAALHAMYEGQ